MRKVIDAPRVVQRVLGLGLGLILAGCCTQPGDLRGPVLEVDISFDGGLCSESIRIDGQNRVWSISGCEASGGNCLVERTQIDASTRAMLEARIAAVAAEAIDPTTVCDPASPFDGFAFVLEPATLGLHYCRNTASTDANAIIEDVRALAP